MDETGENHARADYHQFMAKIALHDGDTARAEECLMAAIKVAKLQGALLFELRGAINLAQLLISVGRGHEVASILAPVHGRIEAGDCVKDQAIAVDILKSVSVR